MPRVGDTIDDKYELIRMIGEGGMGAVFEASHLRIRKKKVAIKFLHADIASDHEALARFKREAEATAAVDHPGIIDVQDIGQLDDGAPFMVLEYLNGQSLSSVLASSKRDGTHLPTSFVVYVACKVLSALSAAHQENIIHRDLKPDNIFLVDIGVERPDIKLLDFGIARFKGPTAEPSTLTSTGAVIGTPFYLSPEQAQGHKDIDHRTDIFSMGAILYECLTGERPFTGPNYPRLIVQLCTESPPPFETYVSGVPEQLQAIVLKALQKNRALRHQSAAELFDELFVFGNQIELNTVIPPRRHGVATLTPSTQHQASVHSQAQPRQDSERQLAQPRQEPLTPVPTIQPASTGGVRPRWTALMLLISSVTALIIAAIAVSVTVYVLSRDERLPEPIGAKIEEAPTRPQVEGTHEEQTERDVPSEATLDLGQPTKTLTGSTAPSAHNEEALQAPDESDAGSDVAARATQTAVSTTSQQESDAGDADPTPPAKTASRPQRPRDDGKQGSRPTRPRDTRPRTDESRPRPTQYGGRPTYGREVSPTPTPTYGREIQ